MLLKGMQERYGVTQLESYRHQLMLESLGPRDGRTKMTAGGSINERNVLSRSCNVSL